MTAVFRSFWPAPPSPYDQLAVLCATQLGHPVEIFSYQAVELPAGARRRDAREMFPEELGPQDDARSRLPHAFRYRILDQLGGWWFEPDVLPLRRYPLPDEDFFAAAEVSGLIGSAVLAGPAGHPLFHAAAEIATTAPGCSDPANWGGILLTRLVHELGLTLGISPFWSAYEMGPE